MSDQSYSSDGIAIVGLAGRFPGADSIDQFWQNLTNGIESITHFSAETLHAAGIAASTLTDENYVPARGTLTGVELFDAAFFGISPKEAELMDPQHRLMLETAWQALESAGYDAEQFAGLIGVYAGMSRNSYFLSNLHPNRHTMPLVETFPAEMGNEKDYLSTRISYKLNLTGPSVNVSTACSTSLVATYHACESLLNLQCDMALAGGVSVRVPQESGYLYEEGSIAAPDGHCRPYDNDAQGTVFGNGVGMVVLKRLEDALEDGDHVYAVIRGSAINNDGASKVNFGAPSVDGQAEVIALAQALADVSAETISYVEGHGTATPLGDPIEVAALTQAFAASTDQTQFCALGSVKSNIGHLDAAAGVAGLIKTALALQNKQIPPTLHFQQPNAKISIEQTPFTIADTLRDWPAGATPRRAGVSAFGTGGTNAHAVLEEAPPRQPSSPSRDQQLIVLSAKTESALAQQKQQLADYLQANPSTPLADIAHTLQRGRKRFNIRYSTVASSAEDAVTTLRNTQYAIQNTQHATRNTVFLFPGQGSQHVNMGRSLYDSEPVYREAVDHCAEILKPLLQLDLRDIIYPDEETPNTQHAIRNTALAQPAIFTISYALAQQWQAWGITPAAMMGHSVGEFVAATLAGVFRLEDALCLLAKRGALMQALQGGSMVAVSLSETELQPRLNAELSIAAINAPNKCVVSGSDEAVAGLIVKLESEEIAFRQLHTSHAFHSPMMDPILDEFELVVESIALNEPTIPFVSSTTGEWITSDLATNPRYWATHLRETVRFADGRATLGAEPDYVLLEVGPGNTLASLSRAGYAQPVCHTLGHPTAAGSATQHMLTALGQLWASGASVDWPAFYANEQRHRLPLPTYPFERKRYWIDAPTITDPTSVEAVSGNSFPKHEGEAASTHVSGKRFPKLTVATAQVSSEESSVVDDGQSEEGLTDAVGRDALIMQGIHAVLFELGGLESAEIDNTATFIELGFDSLFITQASLALKKQFAVKVTFRQLMEDTPTPNALAAFLNDKLPADFGASQQVSPSVGQPKKKQATDSREQATVNGVDDALVQRLLAALEGKQATPESAFPANWNLTTHATRNTQHATRPDSKKFGPWKPYQKSEDIQSLTDKQQIALLRLIDRYTSKTAGSKALAQEHRSHLADPRTASGFRALFKEMVYPIVADRSSGAKLWDVDGNEYIDIQSGFGSVMFGHSPKFVTEAVQKQLEQGIQIGPQSSVVGETARMICEMTGTERMTFCNTGSEAVMAAMRIARTVSGRDLIVTFADDYHGQFDEVLVRGIMREDVPATLPIAPGIPRNAVKNMLVLPFGDPASLDIIAERADEIAAVMVESVQSRRPSYQPRQFLQQVRAWTKRNDVAFILDEVITGFRLSRQGAQGWYDIDADLITYGKVIGGGMPIGLLAGRRRYMDALDGGQWQFGDDSFPEVGVTYFAGTFVRHPLVVAGANAVIKYLRANPDLQDKLNAKAERFVATVNDTFKRLGAPLFLESCGSMLHFKHFDDYDFTSLFYNHLRVEGVFLMAQRGFFLTTAHSEDDLRKVVQVIEMSCRFMLSAEFWPTLTAHEWRNTVLSFDPDQLPLTAEQHEIWLAAQMGDVASTAYNEAFSLELDGTLDYNTLNQAIATVTSRHQALWLQMAADGQSQRLTAPRPLPIQLDDFSQLAALEQRTAIDNAIAAEAATAFDLTQAPLIRFRLFKTGVAAHSLYIVAHHIVFDGWSSGVLLSELRTAYAALHAGEAIALDAPDSWQAFVAEENNAAEKAPALTYWKEQFATLPTPLQLPTDRPRPATKSYRGASLHWQFDSSVIAAARAAAKREGSSFFMLLLSAYQLLLHRLSGQDDFVVGIALAGQLNAGMPDLIGHAVKLLPLRVRMADAMTFSDHLQQAKQTFFDAQEQQATSFGNIIQQLDLPRDASRNPLVDVVFNLDRADDSDGAFANLTSAVRIAPKTAINWDTFLNLSETNETLLANFEYSSDLFDEETLVRWLEHFQTILAAIATDPQQSVAHVPLLSDAQRQQQLVEWNATQRDYPIERLIHTVIEQQVAATADAPAWVFEDAYLSYGELNNRANQLAHHLQAQGVGAETRVGIFMDRSFDMGVAVLGVLKAGGSYVPLAPDYPAERVAFILEDSNAPLLITQERFATNFANLNTPLVLIDSEWASIAEQPVATPACAATPDSVAFIIYTSGSTGQPKGALLSHRAIVNFCTWYNNKYDLDADDAMILLAPFGFDAATWEILAPLSSGGRVVVPKPGGVTDSDYIINLIAQQKVTNTFVVPSYLRLLLNNRNVGKLACMKVLMCGGEAFAEDLRATFNERVPGVGLHNAYGPTETCILALTWDSAENTPQTITTPIGRPLDNMQAYVLGAQMQPCPVGVIGELYIGGPQVAQGYHNRPELTAERFLDNPFGTDKLYKTGDQVKWRADGSVEYIGRIDQQIKLRGLRIELGEIEAGLSAHRNIDQSIVVVQDDGQDKSIVAYSVMANGTQPSPNELRDHLKQLVPHYMVPSEFVTIDHVPLSPNGKLDRRALPSVSRQVASSATNNAPRTALEYRLLQLWQQAFKRSDIGITDNFFELGGHSLQAIRLFQQIEGIFGRKIPVAMLSQAPTIAAIAAIIEADGWNPAWSSLVPIRPAGSKTPFFHVGAYNESILAFQALSGYLDQERPFYGLQPQGLDGIRPIHTDIASMAAHYIDEIKTVQPRSPYILGGHCAGAWVAFEMACQLEAIGEQVQFLGLVDSEPPHVQAPRTNPLRYAVSRASYYLKDKRLVDALAWQYKINVQSKLVYKLGGGQAQAVEAVRQTHQQAYHQYQPSGTFQGDITLLRSSEVASSSEYDWHLRWSELAAGNTSAHAVDSTHATLLHEPQVAQLAHILNGQIDKATASVQDTKFLAAKLGA